MSLLFKAITKRAVRKALTESPASLSAVKTIFGIGNVANDIELAAESVVSGGTLAVSLNTLAAGTVVGGVYDAVENNLVNDGLTDNQKSALRNVYVTLIENILADDNVRQEAANILGITLTSSYQDFFFVNAMAYELAKSHALAVAN